MDKKINLERVFENVLREGNTCGSFGAFDYEEFETKGMLGQTPLRKQSNRIYKKLCGDFLNVIKATAKEYKDLKNEVAFVYMIKGAMATALDKWQGFDPNTNMMGGEL